MARAAIPFLAFADAVEEYEADSVTDDKGDMMNYEYLICCGSGMGLSKKKPFSSVFGFNN